jgi:hypothetical protein
MLSQARSGHLTAIERPVNAAAIAAAFFRIEECKKGRPVIGFWLISGPAQQ